MFLASLNRRPHDLVRITDDDVAAAAFLELGWIEKVQQKCTLTPVGTIVLTNSKHSTHWIIGVHFGGCARPEDDGYALVCLPKSEYTPDMANAEVRQIVEGQGGSMTKGQHFSSPAAERN